MAGGGIKPLADTILGTGIGALKEEALLHEVDPDGLMHLLDGRMLRLNPGDISTAICWSPTSTLEISDTDDDRFFTLSIKIQGTDLEIRGRWE